MVGSLSAGILVGAALLICLLAWGEQTYAYSKGSVVYFLAFAAILILLALIVLAHL